MREVDKGLVEPLRLWGPRICKSSARFCFRNSPGILAGLTIAVVSLIGYSAMAGVVGGGGLGDIAIRYGYQRFRADVMLATIIILIVGVNLIQACGDFASRKKNKK